MIYSSMKALWNSKDKWDKQREFSLNLIKFLSVGTNLDNSSILAPNRILYDLLRNI